MRLGFLQVGRSADGLCRIGFQAVSGYQLAWVQGWLRVAGREASKHCDKSSVEAQIATP